MPKVEKGALRIEVGEKKTLVWQEIWVDDRRAGFTLLENGNLNHIPQRCETWTRVETIEVGPNDPPPEH